MTKYGYGTGRINANSGRNLSRNPKTGEWGTRPSSSTAFSKLKQSGGSFRGVKREG